MAARRGFARHVRPLRRRWVSVPAAASFSEGVSPGGAVCGGTAPVPSIAAGPAVRWARARLAMPRVDVAPGGALGGGTGPTPPGGTRTAPTFRSATSTSYASRTNTTISVPSGVVAGDSDAVVPATGGAGAPTATPPPGWTAIPGWTSPTVVLDNSLFTVNGYGGYHVATSSEPLSYTATHASGTSQALMLAYSGVDASTAFDVNATTNGASSPSGGPTATATGLTTTTDNTMLVWLGHDWGNGSANLSPPTGFTERVEVDPLIYAADSVQATAGATGNVSHTANNVGTNDAWAAILVALRGVSSGSVIDNVSPGGGVGSGMAPSAAVTTTTGAALGAGSAPSARVPAGPGGAVGGGTGPAIPGGDSAPAGGAVGAGTSPTGAVASTLPGGAVAQGTAPTARLTFTISGAIGGGTAPSGAVALALPGGLVAQGTGPAARATLLPGGALGSGTGPTASASKPARRPRRAGDGPSRACHPQPGRRGRRWADDRAAHRLRALGVLRRAADRRHPLAAALDRHAVAGRRDSDDHRGAEHGDDHEHRHQRDRHAGHDRRGAERHRRDGRDPEPAQHRRGLSVADSR